MAWNNDGHGIVCKPTEVKVYAKTHTWAMKLSQLDRMTAKIRFITYSIDCDYYITGLLHKRPHNMQLVCHAKFEAAAQAHKDSCPGIDIAVHSGVHSKVCLIEPGTLYIGSSNLSGMGKKWHETVVGVRSAEAHDWYVENSFDPLWSESKVLTTENTKARW